MLYQRVSLLKERTKRTKRFFRFGIFFYLIFSILIIWQFLNFKKIRIFIKELVAVKIGKIKDFKCLPSGWSTEGTKAFWSFYFYPELPSIQDAFEDNGKLSIVLGCAFVQTHKRYLRRLRKFMSSDWALFLHENENSDPINPENPIINQKIPNLKWKAKTIPLIFELPSQYQNKYHYATIQMIVKKNTNFRKLNENEVTNNPKYKNGETEFQGYQNYTKIFMDPVKESDIFEYGLNYRFIPFCQILDKYSIYVNNGSIPKRTFAQICTQNLIFEDYERDVALVRWALYHIDQGFDTPVIYYNKIIPKDNHQAGDDPEIAQKAFQTLKPVIDKNIIKFIRWEFPYAFYFHDQMGQEMSCILRSRGRTMWLGMNDVDEFFYPMANDTTVFEILKRFTNRKFFKKYGGVLAPNLFMNVMEDGKVQSEDIANFCRKN